MPTADARGMTDLKKSNLWRADLLVIVTISALVSLLVAGTVVYHYLEHWSWVSSFYFTVCTLTTVGYGDLFPTSEASQLFTAIFALAGVTIAFTSLGMLGSIYLRRGERMLLRVRETKEE